MPNTLESELAALRRELKQAHLTIRQLRMVAAHSAGLLLVGVPVDDVAERLRHVGLGGDPLWEPGTAPRETEEP